MRDVQFTPSRGHIVARRSRSGTMPSSVLDGVVLRKPSCACGGGCPRCAAQTLQRKPAISSPGDAHEREADAMADRVMRSAEPAHVVRQGGAAESTLHRQPTDEESKPTPKPLVPIPFFDKFDVAPFVPAPGGSAPTPFDAPGNTTDPSGKGPSMEDLNAARSLLDKKPLQLGLNYNATMPGCSMLEASGSTKESRRYRTFEQYDLDCKVFHGPLSKDPWPVLDRDSYNQAIGACPKSEPPMLKPDFPIERPPLQDAPERTLPEGQAYA
jgi:hypothetical protein